MGSRVLVTRFVSQLFKWLRHTLNQTNSSGRVKGPGNAKNPQTLSPGLGRLKYSLLRYLHKLYIRIVHFNIVVKSRSTA